MLWVVRICRHVPRQPSRSFSLTPNYRLPRIFPRCDTRHAHHTHKPESTADERPQQGPSTESPPGGEAKPPTATNQVLVSRDYHMPCCCLTWLPPQFVVAGSLIALGVAARLTNVDTYDWTNKVAESDITWQFRTPNNGELRRARYYELGKVIVASIPSFTYRSPTTLGTETPSQFEQAGRSSVRAAARHPRDGRVRLHTARSVGAEHHRGRARVLWPRGDPRTRLARLADPAPRPLHDAALHAPPALRPVLHPADERVQASPLSAPL